MPFEQNSLKNEYKNISQITKIVYKHPSVGENNNRGDKW